MEWWCSRSSRSPKGPCRHPGSPVLLPASCGGHGSSWLCTISPTSPSLAMQGCTSLGAPVPPEVDVFSNLISLWQLTLCCKDPVDDLWLFCSETEELPKSFNMLNTCFGVHIATLLIVKGKKYSVLLLSRIYPHFPLIFFIYCT